MTRPVDEETPLLANEPPKKKTPLPWAQFGIVLFLQLAEPLTSQVITPFAPELMRSIGVTNGDETKVGYYVGLMISLFFLTQAMTVLHWSRLSDHIGRKPVILTGLFGLCISMYCFGLSRTFWGLVLSRCLNGALNGNIGVIKSMMAEMTDETNVADAFAYFPMAWSTGSVLGPMIGGSLSDPVERFPNVFGHNEFLKKYPYFLPCAIPATFTAIAWTVTFFFLKETIPNPKPWYTLLGFSSKDKAAKLLADDSDEEQDPAVAAKAKPLPLSQLLTRKVLVAAGNYAFLSLVEIAFRAVQPVFFSTPIQLGGLGFEPNVIGNILSAFGILNGVFQVFFFAKIHNRIGSKRLFVTGISCAFPMVMTLPLLNWLARNYGIGKAVWGVIALQTVLTVALSMSYGAVFIYIAAASPNRASLGATNGLSQMTVSVMRAVGPAAANSVWSLTLKNGYLGGYLVYYFLLFIVGLALLVASLLPRKLWPRLD